MPMSKYDPARATFASFARVRLDFAEGRDDPRRFLERCLEQIAAREPVVQAFVQLDIAGARIAADAAAVRWRDGRALSPIDGMPFGVKDCFDVAGMPTRVNSAVFAEAPQALSDAAHVDAMRHAGAIVLGKTTTTEWTMAAGPATRNPWDETRTPGGSSAGSAAAVAAGMLPLATGSQVRGSGIRPGSICGVPAFKPTFGALNRHGGIDPSPSLNHLALLGASLEDIWDTAVVIAQDVGGDPGCRRLAGPVSYPAARPPLRLARQYTAGWERTDAASQAVFEHWLGQVRALGIEVLEPDADPALRAYEDATAAMHGWFFDLFREILWPLRALRAAHPDRFGAIMHGHIDRAEALPPEAFDAALRHRAHLQALHRGLEGRVDGFVTLAHIGPGQLGSPPVGTPWYNDASSAIGAPSLNLPLLAVDGLPLGVQLMGFEHRDADLIAIGRWLDAASRPGAAARP
jgi:Asp-tRNA(Asn)/Glu-tRNA(Gln) amidotransferase A subunit family amidase